MSDEPKRYVVNGMAEPCEYGNYVLNADYCRDTAALREQVRLAEYGVGVAQRARDHQAELYSGCEEENTELRAARDRAQERADAAESQVAALTEERDQALEDAVGAASDWQEADTHCRKLAAALREAIERLDGMMSRGGGTAWVYALECVKADIALVRGDLARALLPHETPGGAKGES